ncbi:MAG: DUF1565 domain-containing protein [Pirellulales bacterium]|nr:DUF1565 domain-containing protein [Pirellulales bacterium]
MAFHETGCRVEFAVVEAAEHSRQPDDSVIWRQRVSEATFNARTRVWEYHITVDPSKLADGPFAVLAKAVPLDDRHLSTKLQRLPLYANAGGALTPKAPVWADCKAGNDETGNGTEASPLRTIRQALKAAGDGGTVHLRPGKHYSAQGLGGGKRRTTWTTIAAAPGVKRDEVEIGPGRTGTDKLRFRNVTLSSNPPTRAYNTIISGENGATIVWLDDCKMHNLKGRWEGGGVVFGNRYVGYVTGGITTEMDRGSHEHNCSTRLFPSVHGAACLAIVGGCLPLVYLGDWAGR